MIPMLAMNDAQANYAALVLMAAGGAAALFGLPAAILNGLDDGEWGWAVVVAVVLAIILLLGWQLAGGWPYPDGSTR